MKKSFYIKLHSICGIVLLLALLSSTCCLVASAEFKRDYSVTVDNPGGGVATGMPVIIKDIKHGSAPNLNLAGWIKSNYTMQYYEYTIDGGVNWIRDDDAIIARPDVKSYCPNTYQTAGFDVDIDVSQLPRGEYDIFLRGYTSKGDIIEVLALLNVKIGKTDTHTTTYTDINLKAFDFQTGKMILQADQPILLGAYNLRNYQYAEIVMDQDTVLTLSSGKDSAISFVASTEASVSNDGGSYTATIDLSNIQYAGDLYLDSQADVGISLIRLYTNVPDYYTGELVVHMTPTPYEYLSGANQVDATLMSDDTVGTYISLFPTNNTNDPYIYFSLNKYLKDTQDVQVSADYYRYAVITLQTFESNSRGLFRLFLCAGEIRGPHGESHVAF